MKILHVINKFGGGGRERRMIQLVKGLEKYSDVEQFSIIYSGDVDYPEVNGTKMEVIPIQSQGRLNICKELITIIGRIHPNIVHLWMDTPTEMIFLPLLKYKFNYKYIAGFVADGNKETGNRLLGYKFSFLFADKIVSNSKAGLIAKGAPMKKSSVLFNGFDFSRINHSQENKSAKEEFAISDNLLVTMCGRVNEAKDWEMFIDLAKRCKKEDCKCKFLAIGDGPLLDKYRQETNQLKNIQFVGRRTDVEAILEASDISVLFTNKKKHAEGISNSLMEAMACEKPVIATEGGGTSELITNKKDGFIIPPGDTESSYLVLNELVKSKQLRARIGAEAKKTIQTKFLLDDMSRNYYELYNSLIIALH